MLESLTRLVIRHKLLVVAVWVGLAVFGMVGSGALEKRWAQEFSIPGEPAYEANKRTTEKFGNGRQYPLQLVYQVDEGRAVDNAAIQQSIDKVAKVAPHTRVSSWFETPEDHFLSDDGKTTYAILYPGGEATFEFDPNLLKMREKLTATTPKGVTSHMTGLNPIYLSQTEEPTGPGVFREVMIGGLGAVVVLLVIFGTLPAIAMPLMIAMVSILSTFGAVWLLTYATDVSIIVQFLIGLVGLGIAIDYALLVLFRFREELGLGKSSEDAIVETMKHAGHSVVISGTTVAIGLVSMVLLPVPFIRAIGLGGMLIPLMSVLATITLLPAVLHKLGPRINSIRIPLAWRLANLDDHHGGKFWPSWSRFVTRRPWPVFAVGAILLAIIVSPALHMNPGDSQIDNQPATGDAAAGRSMLAKADVADGVYGPINILVEGDADESAVGALVTKIRKVDGVFGASAPDTESWNKDGSRLIEVLPDFDPAVEETADLIETLQDTTVPDAREAFGDDVDVTVAGGPAESLDFVHAVYDNFWILLAFVVGLTYILLARSLRSLVLPLKAVVLNLLSLGAAFGVIVFVFQDGNLSEAIWGYNATDTIVSWIPIMIFAFLFGISMDYEVFMLTRIREAYDQSRDTSTAVAEGLTRTGKLVTSAAAILMFVFLVMSTQPGPDFKQFAIGLAAGIVIDATLIRVLLVPATVKLLGRANWWMPGWARKVLFLPPDDSDLQGPPSTPPGPSSDAKPLAGTLV